MDFRKKVWEKLASDWKFVMLDKIYKKILPDQLDDKIKQMLKGKMKGRIIVNLN